MQKMSIRNKLLTVVLSLCALCTARAWTADEQTPVSDVNPRVGEQAYRKAITAAESSGGAYGEQLSESLLGLALTLQSEGRHEEAIEAFRRGTHLTRINGGLYCPEQIPLVQGEITSQLASKNYVLADERQRYLYRVQTHNVDSGEAFTEALMQQAQWQYEAYQLGLEQESYTRLIDMWELYRQAMNDVITREGEQSPKLLPPLHGMLEAQYLISSYRWVEPVPVFGEQPQFSESMIRFKAYRAKSYEQGNAVIAAISGIEQGRDTDARSLAQTQVMLGDWRLWNGRTDAAWEAYGEAERELAQADDAQELQHIFGVPVALPDIPQLNPLPPTVDPEQGDVVVAFGVSEQGRVQDLQRMDDNDAQDRQASRLLRQLRRTKFRPRFEAGQPVETQNVVTAFDIIE